MHYAQLALFSMWSLQAELYAHMPAPPKRQHSPMQVVFAYIYIRLFACCTKGLYMGQWCHWWTYICELNHILMLLFAVAWPKAQLLVAATTKQSLCNRWLIFVLTMGSWSVYMCVDGQSCAVLIFEPALTNIESFERLIQLTGHVAHVNISDTLLSSMKSNAQR